MRIYHKHCIVRDCPYSSITAPHKYFFTVPAQRKQKWLDIAGNTELTINTCYICDDHFKIPDDFRNWQEYVNDKPPNKRNKKRPLFRKNVSPHINVPRPIHRPEALEDEILYPKIEFGLKNSSKKPLTNSSSTNSENVSQNSSKSINNTPEKIADEVINTVQLKDSNTAKLSSKIICLFCLKESKGEEEMFQLFSQCKFDAMWLCKITEINVDVYDKMINKSICADCNNLATAVFNFVQKVSESANKIKTMDNKFPIEVIYIKSESFEPVGELIKPNKPSKKRKRTAGKKNCNLLSKPTKLRKKRLNSELSDFQHSNSAIDSSSNDSQDYSTPKTKKKITKEKKISMLNCEVCAEACSNETSLSQHMLTHGDKTIKCTKCSEMFYNEELLLTHTKRKHKYVCKEFPCPTPNCGKVYLSRLSFQNHLKTHEKDTEISKFLCHICSKSFTTNFSLQNHIDSHEVKTENVRCQICGTYFSTETAAQRHMSTHGVKGELRCNICEQPFKTVKVLRLHMLAIHNDAMKPTCTSKYCEEWKDRNCREFTQEMRNKVFETFWGLETREQRKVFVCGLIDAVDVQRRRTKNQSKRNFTFNYFLPFEDKRLQVCKQMFINTLNIGPRTVVEWTKDRVS